MSASVHTVVVIDDHPLFRKGAADLLAMDPSLRMVGEASGGEQGLAVVKQQQPDLVLLDADPLERIENTREIAAVVSAGRYLRAEDFDKLAPLDR